MRDWRSRTRLLPWKHTGGLRSQLPERSSSGHASAGVNSALIAIARDRAWQLCVLFAVLASIPLGIDGARGARIESWLDVALLAISVAVLSVRLGTLSRSERRFWQLWTAAMGCWLAARVAALMMPADWRGPTYSLANDCAYLIYFLLLFLAVESTPHRVEGLGFDQRLRQLRLAGTTMLIFGLLIYFVVIPRHVKPGVYDSWLPRFDLYVALGLTLAIAFASLARSCGNRRWRLLYGLLAGALGLWALGDLLNGLGQAERSTLTLPPLLEDVVWHAPIVLLVTAARGRHLIRDAMESTAERSVRMHIGRPLALAAFALPSLHLVLHAFDLGDRDLQHTRELLVLIAILLLGAMAYIEQRRMEQQVQQAATERRATTERAIERSAFLNALIAQSPLAITSLDSEYRITLSNPGLRGLVRLQRGRDQGPIAAPFHSSRRQDRRSLEGRR